VVTLFVQGFMMLLCTLARSGVQGMLQLSHVGRGTCTVLLLLLVTCGDRPAASKPSQRDSCVFACMRAC